MNAPANGNKRVILNVNDNPGTLYLVGRILKAHGFVVVDATNGIDALEKAKRESPSLVVLDIKLPDVDGYEVARRLKSDPSTAHIPVLATSATFVTTESRTQGLESGADAYLTQPFESLELVALVEALLRGKQHEREARAKAAALTEADHRKDEFLAMLAHELRNPLGAILAAASLIQDDAVPRQETRRLGHTIQRQARHLAKMVDDLLDVSRITRGQITLARRVLDLRGSIENAVQGLAHVLRAKEQPLSVELPADGAPIWIDGDATRVEQILQNLLGNASKYSDHSAPIALSVIREGDRFVIRIRDHGIGIEPEHLPRIFDLFYQVDSTLARTVGGLGIGLTMVQRLVELHGGTITVASDGLNKGTEVVVSFPRAEAPSEEAQRAEADFAHHADGALRGEKLRILLVDDNVESSHVFELALASAGHAVDLAHDGKRGLELARNGQYHAAIVDIGLPGIDGYELARGVVASLGDKRPKLIALTGYGREEDRERAFKAGFDLHLVKPIDLAVMEQAVARVLYPDRANRSR